MNFKQTKSTKACGGCPFKRVNTNEKPNPGGSHPFVYIGQRYRWRDCKKPIIRRSIKYDDGSRVVQEKCNKKRI